jgi:hypothetical protein
VQITSFCLPELYNSVVETLNAAEADSKAAVLSEYHADTNFDENKEIRASLFAEILSASACFLLRLLTLYCLLSAYARIELKRFQLTEEQLSTTVCTDVLFLFTSHRLDGKTKVGPRRAPAW